MRYCFCILGWHFGEEFYSKVFGTSGKKHIICHRDEPYFADRPTLFEKIKSDLHFCENRGLEWGGYHQFIEMNLHLDQDFVIFCHDDLIIKDPGFVQALEERFRDPAIIVVGNGRNGADWEFPFKKHKEWMLFRDEDDFVVRTVRGSFFAARSVIFTIIGNFPVHWRAKKMKYGNISLRNFGYLVSKNFGRESISYLDPENHLDTKYLTELRRGGE